MPIFDYETLYRYAFYAKKTKKIKKGDIAKFARILEKEVPKSKKPQHKYVVFDGSFFFDGSHISKYFRDDFSEIGDDVYLNIDEIDNKKKLDKNNWSNNYDEYILGCLEEASKKLYLSKDP